MSVTHIGPRSLGASMKLPTTFLNAAALLGMSVPDFATAPKSFKFRREKRAGVWGWRIEITIGRLTLCRNWTDGIPFPRRRNDAAMWAASFAARHGFTFVDANARTRR